MEVWAALLADLAQKWSGSTGIPDLGGGRECGCVEQRTRHLRRSCAIYILRIRVHCFSRDGIMYLKDCPHRSVVFMQSSDKLTGSFCQSARLRAPILALP